MSVIGMLVHTATVEPFEGSGPYGEVYGPSVMVPCYFEGRRELVRGSAGEEVVSEGVMYTELRDDVTPGSRVSVEGRDTWVLSVSRFSGTGMAHLAVALA